MDVRFENRPKKTDKIKISTFLEPIFLLSALIHALYLFSFQFPGPPPKKNGLLNPWSMLSSPMIVENFWGSTIPVAPHLENRKYHWKYPLAPNVHSSIPSASSAFQSRWWCERYGGSSRPLGRDSTPTSKVTVHWGDFPAQDPGGKNPMFSPNQQKPHWRSWRFVSSPMHYGFPLGRVRVYLRIPMDG